MSQLPSNTPDNPPVNPTMSDSNMPPPWTANQMYDNSGNIYSHHPFHGQPAHPSYMNWLQAGFHPGYSHTFLPPPTITSTAQFNISNQIPSSTPPIQQQPSRKRTTESFGEESEGDENHTPEKSPRMKNEDEERRYLELDSESQPAYTQTLSASSNSFSHSTPVGIHSYAYQPSNFDTPPAQLSMFNYNQAFASQFPLMNPQLYNHYTNSPSAVYSASASTFPPHNFSSDTSSNHLQGTLSTLDSGLGSSGQSSGSTALQLDIKGCEMNGRTEFDVSGRLALLNSNQKYNVSVGEITRRLGAPENMNNSLLGAMLRRAKNRNGGKGLREALTKYNIKLPEGRRRSLENTAFTAFVEAEAMKLASDFEQVLHDYFPTRLILLEIALTFQHNHIHQQQQPAGHPQQSQNFFQLLEAIDSSNDDPEQQVDYIVDLLMSIMETMCVVLERDRSLVDMGIEDPETMYGKPLLPTELQKGLMDFNLVTHNFGVKAVLAGYRSMCSPQFGVHKVESPDSSGSDE